MTDLKGILKLRGEKVSQILKFKVVPCLWRFTQWRGIFTSKQNQQKTLEFKLKAVTNFKATANFFKKNQFIEKRKKNQFIDLFIFITLHKNMMIQ